MVVGGSDLRVQTASPPVSRPLSPTNSGESTAHLQGYSKRPFAQAVAGGPRAFTHGGQRISTTTADRRSFKRSVKRSWRGTTTNRQTDRQTDEQDRQTDKRQTDRQTDRTDRQTEQNRQTDKQTDGQTNGQDRQKCRGRSTTS
jgi:hypothetical protein